MKNQKGITLITLMITIVVLLILTFTVSVNISIYIEQRKITNFQSDIETLK